MALTYCSCMLTYCMRSGAAHSPCELHLLLNGFDYMRMAMASGQRPYATGKVQMAFPIAGVDVRATCTIGHHLLQSDGPTHRLSLSAGPSAMPQHQLRTVNLATAGGRCLSTLRVKEGGGRSMSCGAARWQRAVTRAADWDDRSAKGAPYRLRGQSDPVALE